MTKKTKVPEAPENVVPLNIPKPKPIGFLEKFKSKRAPTIGGVETFSPRSHITRSRRPMIRPLHPAEDNYWSPELCFVRYRLKARNGTCCT